MNKYMHSIVILITIISSFSLWTMNDDRGGRKSLASEQERKIINNIIDTLNNLEGNAFWPKRKELIREAIENYSIHPDTIRYDFRIVPYVAITPIDDARDNSDKDFIEYLLQKKSDPDQLIEGVPLLWRVKDYDIAKLLVLSGADVNACYRGRNLLFSMTALKDRRFALLYYCAGINPKMIEVETAPNRGEDSRYSILTWLLAGHTYAGVKNVPAQAALFVKMGAPIDHKSGPYKKENYMELLVGLPCLSDEKKRQILEEIEIAKNEVIEAQMECVKEERELPDVLKNYIPISALTTLVLEYDNKQERAVPLTLLNEIEEMGLQFPLEKNKHSKNRGSL